MTATSSGINPFSSSSSAEKLGRQRVSNQSPG